MMIAGISINTDAQNIGIGTNAPAGKLHIKGSADVSQLVIDANTTQSNTHPLIRLRTAAGQDLMYIHSDDTANTFIGLNAGQFNAADKSGYGIYNTFTGSNAGASNTMGYGNTATGFTALTRNNTGYDNTATGNSSLYFNTTGRLNTAYGALTLINNRTGSFNTAIGSGVLANCVTGNYNTGVGENTLSATTASEYNTALGYNAGYGFDNGYNNVFLGANTDVNNAGYYNVIAIGQGTICTAPSQVTIGNGATNSYRAYANWSNISDGRFKKNVQENVPGLDFITKLRPVTYGLDATGLNVFLHKQNKNTETNNAMKSIENKSLLEKEAITYTGFVAQEVEATAKAIGFNFSGVDAPKDNNDFYGLRYAEFVVPLVKAVQEQQQMIEELKNENETQKSFNSDLQKQIDELKMLVKK